MAEHGTSSATGVEYSTTGVDYAERRQTYRSFLRNVRYCVVVIVILLIFLAWLY